MVGPSPPAGLRLTKVKNAHSMTVQQEEKKREMLQRYNHIQNHIDEKGRTVDEKAVEWEVRYMGGRSLKSMEGCVEESVQTKKQRLVKKKKESKSRHNKGKKDRVVAR